MILISKRNGTQNFKNTRRRIEYTVLRDVVVNGSNLEIYIAKVAGSMANVAAVKQRYVAYAAANGTAPETVPRTKKPIGYSRLPKKPDGKDVIVAGRWSS